MSSILELDQLKQMVKNPHIDHWHAVLDQLLELTHRYVWHTLWHSVLMSLEILFLSKKT